jgi:hypothetical protein
MVYVKYIVNCPFVTQYQLILKSVPVRFEGFMALTRKSRLRLSGLCRCVDWYKFTDVLEKHTACLLN